MKGLKSEIWIFSSKFRINQRLEIFFLSWGGLKILGLIVACILF